VKRLSILGSTGSIGQSTLDVVERHPGAFRVVALGAGRNLSRLEDQVRRFEPDLVAVADASAACELRARLSPRVRVVSGVEGLEEIARHPETDLVVSALVGAVGLLPTYAAVEAGKTVALANKEALVVGGSFLTARARETGAVLLPVDSEHNALHQCLRGESPGEVCRLWLTASGGPFRTRSPESMSTVSAAEALCHPTWSMGRKVTIDSATLMNKGLEVIEARWLFAMDPDRIRVVIHPQSVVHSMVEFVDGSFKAQLGVTDMRSPIQYALTWPERWRSFLPVFSPVDAGPLEFEDPDLERFPCLGMAYEALRHGGAAPAVLNAANEVAVQAFLDGAAGFLEIPAVLRVALDRHGHAPAGDLHDLLSADARARETAGRVLAQGVRK